MGQNGNREGSYLFCYQEVISQCFSGADGSQKEDKDQIQEPPVGHQHTDLLTAPFLLLIGIFFNNSTIGDAGLFVLSNQSGNNSPFQKYHKVICEQPRK